MKHSIAVLCGDLKATFGTGLVCTAVQQGKTMHCELWLWPYACVTGACVSPISVAHGPALEGRLLRLRKVQIKGTERLAVLRANVIALALGRRHALPSTHASYLQSNTLGAVVIGPRLRVQHGRVVVASCGVIGKPWRRQGGGRTKEKE